ncbi:hypothetical protein ACPRNU_20410 [Chromobacterium vaccinii]|uniref:hypothetical protein n=1 Tax=Chromobacterium vaccinii TaxID=1108595 RepID=UPI003C7624BF
MNTKTLVLVAVLALSACSDGDAARKALNGAGYTNIKITGWKPLGCSKDDSFTTGFEARGPTGMQVEGVVCSSMMFKGATIRTE